jgi:hypothetical protein
VKKNRQTVRLRADVPRTHVRRILRAIQHQLDSPKASGSEVESELFDRIRQLPPIRIARRR